MIKSIERSLRENIKNIPGWRTKRKLLVLESDDWGSLRIGNDDHKAILFEKGFLKKDEKSMAILDYLETSSDVKALFDALTSVSDGKGSPAVLTPFYNMGNPDYDKIIESKFSQYYFESFDSTYKKYSGNSPLTLIKGGVSKGIFSPELHGLEHINIPTWFSELQEESNEILRKGCYVKWVPNIPSNDLRPFVGYRQALYARNQKDIYDNNIRLTKSIELFKNIFGIAPIVFDAPNALSHQSYESLLSKNGIKSIVTPFVRNEPNLGGGIKREKYSFGKVNKHGQIYHVRNCMFEPFDGRNEETALRMVTAAFRWNKPAVISTHRVNFVGDKNYRDENLDRLLNLLKRIKAKYPNVEFISSRQLSSIMHNQ